MFDLFVYDSVSVFVVLVWFWCFKVCYWFVIVLIVFNY